MGLIFSCPFPVSASADSHPNSRALEPFENYYYSQNIILRVAEFEHLIKLFRWLDAIQLTEIGKKTIHAIETSGHELMIFHDESALYSAGMTGAPMTRNLTNGVGESAYIRFYVDMNQHGSNCVFGKQGEYIDFTAVHNLFHELSHARHKMNGTWNYIDPEGQAIREENIFRIQWSGYRYEAFSLRSEFMEQEDVIRRINNSCQS